LIKESSFTGNVARANTTFGVQRFSIFSGLTCSALNYIGFNGVPLGNQGFSITNWDLSAAKDRTRFLGNANAGDN